MPSVTQRSKPPTPGSHSPIPKAVGRWFAEATDGATAPHYVEQYLDRQAFYDEARINVFINKYRLTTRDLVAMKDSFDAELDGWADRVDYEDQLADYLARVYSHTGEREYADLSEGCYACHRHAPLGIRPDGGFYYAWDHKCEKTRICPHASRENTMRLFERYVPGIRMCLDDDPRRRAQYLVFTLPNIPRGELAEHIELIYVLFKEWLAKFDCIVGAFTSLEVPLSKSGDDWNIHLNAIVIVQGGFSWEDARAEWGHDLHLDNISRDGLANSVQELVKYTTKITDMLGWDYDAFDEWWQAHKRFRRTRSYGCLYAIESKRWNNADFEKRLEWIKTAQTYDFSFPLTEYFGTDWRDIPDGYKSVVVETEEGATERKRVRDEEQPQHRQILRDAMVMGERVPLDVYWCGAVDYLAAERRFYVDLIPGHNFLSDEHVAPPHRPITPAYLHPPPFP